MKDRLSKVWKFITSWKVLALLSLTISINEIYKGDYSEAFAWFIIFLYQAILALEELANKITLDPYDWT
jgi:hypothetical protein